MPLQTLRVLHYLAPQPERKGLYFIDEDRYEAMS